MTILQWDDAFLLGEPSLDQQHKVLVQLINELSTAMDTSAQEGPDSDFVLAELASHLYAHMDYEEQLFEDRGFSELLSHKLLHEKYRQIFHDLYLAFKDEDRPDKIQVLQKMVEWVENHIAKEDAKFKPYLS
ncbi:hypothetical protein MTBPR1_50098 [Candidatus Terasakiella magnetica]|uniref:Hemerythrin-like domain-containing protein n=1 Tax=Candidatus Terasakiella magnetica TaxID=1867952 RepID=A0A1C3RJ95_9PROT|nr:bacteriohemerythrin [Candidatus Terasakiella magnetica]SCA57342.1 hypothetical protein MTBPR1_50098 [Candidatus Terasakiella magnetica]